MNPKDRVRKLYDIIIDASRQFPALHVNSKMHWNIYDEKLEENSDLHIECNYETSYTVEKLGIEEKKILEPIMIEQEQNLVELLINNTKDFDSFLICQYYDFHYYEEYSNPWIYKKDGINKLKFGRKFNIESRELFGSLPDLRNILRPAVELYKECLYYKKRFYEYRENLLSNNHESFYKFADETVKKMMICSKGTEGMDTFEKSMIDITKMYKDDVLRLLSLPINKESIRIFTKDPDIDIND